jgi:hypothetical protein
MAAQAFTISAQVATVAHQVATPAKAARAVVRAPVNQFAKKTVSNGSKTRAMQVWQPTNNKYAPTLAYWHRDSVELRQSPSPLTIL